jgi:hypothetical protein
MLQLSLPVPLLLLLLLLVQVGQEEEGVRQHSRRGGRQQTRVESAQGEYWLAVRRGPLSIVFLAPQAAMIV